MCKCSVNRLKWCAHWNLAMKWNVKLSILIFCERHHTFAPPNEQDYVTMTWNLDKRILEIPANCKINFRFPFLVSFFGCPALRNSLRFTISGISISSLKKKPIFSQKRKKQRFHFDFIHFQFSVRGFCFHQLKFLLFRCHYLLYACMFYMRVHTAKRKWKREREYGNLILDFRFLIKYTMRRI